MSLATTIDFISTNPIAREVAGEAAKSTAQGAALHWGARLGARLIPGVGEALLVYDVVQGADMALGFGCKYLTGRNWEDTSIGRTVHQTLEKTNAVAATASGYVVDGAASLLSAVGCAKAGDKVASWGKYLLCGDDGKPVANETIASNPICQRGVERKAGRLDLPTPECTSATPCDLARLAEFKHGHKSTQPEVTGATLAALTGTPASMPNRDLAARDQTRLASLAPKSSAEQVADRLSVFNTPVDQRAAPRRASSYEIDR